MEHTSISPQEAADRLAIRELIDAYAHCADRREAEGQKALFTEDTHFVVYMNGFGTLLVGRLGAGGRATAKPGVSGPPSGPRRRPQPARQLLPPR